ncbi:hypothetical protein ACIQI8_28870 [Streptomyces sp. NPDC092369]|uniref:hypothetical protein n=1 Tax=Streptomyces sp. NPDC092369 TaxID=3366015 RepID=UPI00381225A4
MSTARRHPHSRAWLRVLMLLLVLLVPGETATAAPTPVAVESVEYDAVEAALPPLVRTVARRPDAPLRPTPLPAPAPYRPKVLSAAVPPHVPDVLRTVVLRC